MSEMEWSSDYYNGLIHTNTSLCKFCNEISSFSALPGLRTKRRYLGSLSFRYCRILGPNLIVCDHRYMERGFERSLLNLKVLLNESLRTLNSDRTAVTLF